MFIEQLDNTRLLITLEQEDLNIFELEPYSISFENNETKSLLKQLLTLAAIKAGVSIKDKSLSVEAMPYDSGCFLLVTIKPKGKRKIYRIKGESTQILTKFNTTEEMLGAVKRIYDTGINPADCSLFEGDGNYYLLIVSDRSLPEKVHHILTEYGEITPCSTMSKARLCEFFNTICEKNAISVVGSRL